MLLMWEAQETARVTRTPVCMFTWSFRGQREWAVSVSVCPTLLCVDAVIVVVINNLPRADVWWFLRSFTRWDLLTRGLAVKFGRTGNAEGLMMSREAAERCHLLSVNVIAPTCPTVMCLCPVSSCLLRPWSDWCSRESGHVTCCISSLPAPSVEPASSHQSD